VCDTEVEDDIHVYFGCVVAREYWSATCLSQLLQNAAYQHGTVANMMFEMCRKEDSATVG
jgi:hypothetical protein